MRQLKHYRRLLILLAMLSAVIFASAKRVRNLVRDTTDFAEGFFMPFPVTLLSELTFKEGHIK